MAAQPRKPLQALNPSTSTPTSNISTRLEKSNPDVCCSIRDLEALASLDDDREHAHLPEATILAPVAKHTRCISVGLLDPEYPSLMASKSDASYSGAHSRGDGQFSVLQRWASRPTLLEELGYDTATVVRVCEDTGDKGSPNSSDGGFGNYTPTQARTIEQLSRENAYLRHAVGQMDSSFRGYAMSSALATSRYAIGTGIHNPHHTQGSVPVGLPVEDLDEVGDIPGYSQIQSNAGRRSYSEHPANQEKQFPAFASVETRTLENVKKAHWDISHGFGNTYDISLSRRHSFADIPIQHIYNSADSSRITVGDQEDIYRGIGEDLVSSAQGQNQSYFARNQALHAANGPSAIPMSRYSACTMPNTDGRHQSGLMYPHQNQLFYIVTFKYHRVDIFSIQDDTGLQVKSGDPVIVEADRGTDLGTIQQANVSMQKAQELKQQYAEYHYKCLMMFSRQGQSAAANLVNTFRSVSGLKGQSDIGGMRSHGSYGVQESAAETKPKLIKRLAQNHEILKLRDKEGNEMKAKQLCQQKVAEHRLNMEILGAEFQMDWKKLTFYYFADSYINFSALVTDLYKIYKTRIWMSAINPASFVTSPSAGLQSPDPLRYSQKTH